MSFGDLLPGPRVLLGPGPAMADPRVLRAMSMPLLGQFDPEFTQIMNEVMDLTRFAFQTTNARTFPVPGTGRSSPCLQARGSVARKSQHSTSVTMWVSRACSRFGVARDARTA